MMNQMAMLTMINGSATQQTIARAPAQIYQPATLPQYMNKGMATPHSTLEDAAEQEDEEEDKDEEEGHDVGAAEVYPRYPYHMSEAISSSHMSREEVRNEDSRQLYTPKK